MTFHSSQTFTYGEQPSASKWQYIWDNDEALRDGSGLLFNNNQEVQAKNSSGTTKKLIRLDDDNYLRLSQIPHQANTSNSTLEDMLIQTGWGFVTGNGVNFSLSDTITFPATYSSTPIMLLTIAGYKTGSDPTTVADVSAATDMTVGACIQTPGTASCVMQIVRRSFDGNSPGALGNGTRYLYQWIAIGPKS